MSNNARPYVTWYMVQPRIIDGTKYAQAQIQIDESKFPHGADGTLQLSIVQVRYGSLAKTFSASNYTTSNGQKNYTVDFSIGELQSDATLWGQICVLAHMASNQSVMDNSIWRGLSDISTYFSIELIASSPEPYNPPPDDPPGEPDDDDETPLPTEQGTQPSSPSSITTADGKAYFKINEKPNSEWIIASDNISYELTDDNTDAKFNKSVLEFSDESLNMVSVKHDYTVPVDMKVKVEYKKYIGTTVIR